MLWSNPNPKPFATLPKLCKVLFFPQGWDAALHLFSKGVHLVGCLIKGVAAQYKEGMAENGKKKKKRYQILAALLYSIIRHHH